MKVFRVPGDMWMCPECRRVMIAGELNRDTMKAEVWCCTYDCERGQIRLSVPILEVELEEAK